MKLFYTPNSPYARTARVAMREYGLLVGCQEIVAANRQPDNPVLEFSPVGRVPTLVTAEVVLTESRAIFDYLQSSGSGDDQITNTRVDWAASAQEGQILGFLDGIALWVRERRRSPEQRSDFIMQVEAERAVRCLSYLNSEAVARRLTDVSSFRGATLAAALELMTLHELVRDWRVEHKALSSWLEQQSSRPSMQQTAPKADLLRV